MTFGYQVLGFGSHPISQITEGRTFDGSNDYGLRGADLTGASDVKQGIFSCWVKFNGGDGSVQTIIQNKPLGGGSYGIWVAKLATNIIYVNLLDSGVAITVEMESSTSYTSSSNFIHILASWDPANSTVHLFVDDIDVENVPNTTVNDAAADYTIGEFGVGANSTTTGANKLDACLSELYLNIGNYLDFSVEANRRLFISSLGTAVDLGADGSTPTSGQPILYLPTGDPSVNAGSGGNLVNQSTIEICGGP